jgi:hypothetical protein
MEKSKKIIWAVVGMLAAVWMACSENVERPVPVTFTYTFNTGTEGWTGDFADYPVGEEDFYELLFEYAMLPAPLNESKGALKMSGNNHSDDLFMFIKKKVTGLQPNTEYKVTFTLEFASDVADNTMGAGGSPGESVYVKAGATRTNPGKIPGNDNFYHMNIDKGNQAQDGADMLLLGDFSNDTNTAVYALKTVSNATPQVVTADENGELWIIAGTDSGFEATTTIYYNSVKVEFF